jgi:hypothetical protein
MGRHQSPNLGDDQGVHEQREAEMVANLIICTWTCLYLPTGGLKQAYVRPYYLRTQIYLNLVVGHGSLPCAGTFAV